MIEITVNSTQLLLGWLALEAVFYVLVNFYLYYQISPLKTPPPYPFDSVEMCNRIITSLDSLETYSFDTFFRGYFKFAPIEDIKHDNLLSFLAWVLFAKKQSDLTEAEVAKTHKQAEFLYKRYRFRLESGFNPSVEHICMTLEDIPYIHRPLLLYVISGLYEGIGSVVYRSHGFRRMELNGVEYWHHAGSSDGSVSAAAPVMLFHGITSGWLSYFALMRNIGLNAGREVFMMDLDAIKMMSLVFEMPSSETYTAIVKRILQRHGVTQGVHVIGHSFGSITAGWFVRAYPQMTTHLTLLDPVSLLLGLPDVAFSFLYRSPSKLMEYLIHFFAAKEITVSHVLRRHFWWYKNILWLEDLPPHISVLVGLAGQDEVTNPVSVQEYVLQIKKQREELAVGEGRREVLGSRAQSQGGRPASCATAIGSVDVVYWPGYSHGQCTTCVKSIDSLVVALDRVENQVAVKGVVAK